MSCFMEKKNNTLLKQAKISANGVRKIISIQSLNKIFLAPLADIFAFLTKYFFFLKQDIISQVILLVKSMHLDSIMFRYLY